MNFAELLALDDQISTRLRVAEQPGLLRTLAAILAHSGDSWFWLVGLALVWLTRIPEWQGRAFALGVGVVLTALVVLTLKFSFRRRRPQGEWGGIYRKSDPHSFPSGHAARAFMLAVMALGLGPAWLAVLLVVWAPLVSLARVSMGLHYVSDVLAGMVIGVLMAVGVLQIFT